MADLNRLTELDRIARETAQRYVRRRHLYDTLAKSSGKHAVGIVGPRGVGKTILLKQLALAQRGSFYLSLDTVEETEDLFALVKTLAEKVGVTSVYLDEIHFQRDYPRHLKMIADSLPVRVVFTSSVALSLFETAADLSRRILLHTLHPFTFREFLLFRTGEDLPPLRLEEIEAGRWEPEHVRRGELFDEYLRGGLMPFSLEEPDPLPLVRNVLEKIVTHDIPAVARLRTDELLAIRKCIEFTGRSSVDGINYSSLSRNVGITRYKAEEYVRLLEKAFVAQAVFPKGAGVTREPKILLCLPVRYLHGSGDALIGGVREDFFVQAMKMHGLHVSYLKSMRGEKTPDFVVDAGRGETVIEIGGRGKGREQFKGYEGRKSLILTPSLESEGKRRPLFMVGYLEAR